MTDTLVDIEKMVEVFQQLQSMGYKFCIMSVPTKEDTDYKIVLQPYDADQDIYNSNKDLNLN